MTGTAGTPVAGESGQTCMKTICYCFGYTDADITEDVRAHGGHSTIAARISDKKQRGACACENKHPKRR